MYKILLGIPAMEREIIIDKEVEDDDSTWCDFELAYFPEDNYYQYSFETMLGFNKDDGARNWIVECLNAMTDYMNSHGYDITTELNMYEAFTDGYNVNTKFKTIEDAYAWLKIMVFGFHGQGL